MPYWIGQYALQAIQTIYHKACQALHMLLFKLKKFNLVSKTFTFVVHNLFLVFISQGYIQKINLINFATFAKLIN
jgi:hypothetical protein